ncbi:MAG: rhamnogalacturonan acetylesterase [Bacteroidota bacterium]|nr:rhamnogalacturonan acetylesterase [Bacteroidota bacterium]
MTRTFKPFAIVSVVTLMSFVLAPARKMKVWLIGDSTCANKEIKAYPETGWGMPFKYFFDTTVEVDNRALNGRSTKSFIAENKWQPVLEKLQEGDYVFIQFGHNDEVQTKAASTKPEEFKSYLLRYVTETRSKQANPVLITPVARRKFDTTGGIVETHKEYSEIVRTVAREQKVPLIDLDKKSQQVLQQFGPETSKLFFNYLQPGENPNYPEGRQDDTHFSELGARRMAEIVLAEVRHLHLDLSNRIVQPEIKKQ